MQEFWTTLKPPYSPSETDIEVYKKYINSDNVLLLGSTKELLHLCSVAIDNDPRYSDTKIQKVDWFDYNNFAECIICDCAPCLSEEIGNGLINKYSKLTNRLVCRIFTKKLDHKVATFFPKPTDFNIVPTIVENLDDYAFYIWDF